MNQQTFKIEKDEFERRKKTLIQHKLRIVLKCYTVFNFELNEDDTFSFRKSHRIKGIRINGKEDLNGKCEIVKSDKKYYHVKIKVF